LREGTRPAIFLDRDGTLIEDTGYVKDPSSVRLLPTVAEALRRFEAAGFLRIVVSNQSGIARGLFDENALRKVERRLAALLAQGEASVNATYHCPHFESGCLCRKPLPGLILTAAAEHAIDLSRSVMIGDRSIDIEAGHAAGIPAVLVTTGPHAYQGSLPDATAPSLIEAAGWILARVL
jgi:D-glycero-D-manno-heptose 1,7-bisphosphate phosphatase